MNTVEDEPFANVDERSAKELVQKIKELHCKGMGVLVVDHRLDYWLDITDVIRLMNRENSMDSVISATTPFTNYICLWFSSSMEHFPKHYRGI